jgi:L-aminopeptidase/D-esterase-like protein
MITEVPGIRVGHATDEAHHTGCSVILCPEGTVGGVEVRGPAPGSRETALLAPEKSVPYVNAILLTGGSAFGLAAADGVMRYLEENEIGHWTPIVRVPIVPAAVVYDLFLGRGRVRPDADMGYTACLNAVIGPVAQGNVGAGAGVTVGKWGGFEGMMKGGFGAASLRVTLEDEPNGGELIVGAAAVANSVGDVLSPDGQVLAGARAPGGGWLAEQDPLRRFPDRPPAALGTNTTLVVVATNASLSKLQVNKLAQRAQDGLAIAVRPVHTTHDGDAVFALATGEVEASLDLVAGAAVEAVAEAIRNAVRHAATVEGIPGLYDPA